MLAVVKSFDIATVSFSNSCCTPHGLRSERLRVRACLFVWFHCYWPSQRGKVKQFISYPRAKCHVTMHYPLNPPPAKLSLHLYRQESFLVGLGHSRKKPWGEIAKKRIPNKYRFYRILNSLLAACTSCVSICQHLCTNAAPF